MKAVETIFQKRGINYGWAMVMVVFTLSGLAFDTLLFKWKGSNGINFCFPKARFFGVWLV